MYPPLPSPQGSVPPAVILPLPHGQILLNGVYYQPLAAPHNVVVAQSMVPQPSIVPITPTEVLALSTTNTISPTESTSDSMVLIESTEVPESTTEGTPCTASPIAETQMGLLAIPFSSASSEPRVGLEFVMPKTPPPTGRPAKML